MRGSEQVVELLCGLFPQADVFTLRWEPRRLSAALASRHVTTSFIDRVANAPLVRGRFRALLPLFPLAVQSFRLERYPLVISSSHCVALGAPAAAQALHIAYVHSTMRYVRESQTAYQASVPGGALGQLAFRAAAGYLRRWEGAVGARPDVMVANSTFTRDRIFRYFGRHAEVIAPPIDTQRFERVAAYRAAADDDRSPLLLVSALVPSKRVELAVRALQGRPERLLVVGEGPERTGLERLAGPNVTFLGWVGERALEELYAGCRALLHPAVDDFGMVMVEAMAAGKPVIACGEGGALDIVRSGTSGILIEAPTVEAVRAALDRFAHSRADFDPKRLQAEARRFDRAVFERRFFEVVERAWHRHETARWPLASARSRRRGGRQ
jgi:glycosyltransferase involved in cell wall biosynthesis